MAEYNHEHSINDTGLETLGKYTTRKSPSLRCNAPYHYSPSHESFITSTYVPHQFITGEQTNSFRHRSAASLCTSSWNVFGEESRYRLCLQARITSFLLTRNRAWFFTRTSVITFRNPCRDFLQQNKDSLLVHDRPRIRLFSIKKPTTVTNQEPSTFPVHRAQSAYLIQNSWNKAFLKKSRWQTVSYLRSVASYTKDVPSIYAIHKNPPLEYIQSQQNLFYSLTPCFFTFVICPSVRMCQSDLHLAYFVTFKIWGLQEYLSTHSDFA